MPYKDREKQRQAARDYYSRNKENCKKSSREWKKKNHDKVLEMAKNDRERNQAAYTMYNQLIRLAFPELYIKDRVLKKNHREKKYRENKDYYKIRHAKERAGELWESALLITKINKEIRNGKEKN